MSQDCVLLKKIMKQILQVTIRAQNINELTQDVQKTSYTSSECPIYIEFTS